MTQAPGRSVAFFDAQFRRQAAAADYRLNPFEERVLPLLSGEVLDLGCGLGNLALAAAARGARVTALDACESAVADLQARAAKAGAAIEVRAIDLRGWRPDRTWDRVACIGLLMFFPREEARAGLAAVRDAVRPGGMAAVNVLVEGTTYLDMFEPGAYYLFAIGEMAGAFAGWKTLDDRVDDFVAPGGTRKRFQTLVVERPAD